MRATALCLLLLCGHAICCYANDDSPGDVPAQEGAGSSQAVAVQESPGQAHTDQDEHGPFLLFIKLRPSKSRTKKDVTSITKTWKPEQWGAEGKIDLNVIDNDAVVLTSESLSDAMKAKDWLLTQTAVYEMELNKGGEVFRRPGDGPIEDLRRRLARAAQEARQERSWAWLRSAAKRQGVRIRRPRHWDKTWGAGGGRRRRQGQEQLPGSRTRQEL